MHLPNVRIVRIFTHLTGTFKYIKYLAGTKSTCGGLGVATVTAVMFVNVLASAGYCHAGWMLLRWLLLSWLAVVMLAGWLMLLSLAGYC